MSEPLHLPVLALRDTVIFPGVTSPIGAGRPETLRAIQEATKGEDHLVFAVAQRENTEEISAENLHAIGTIARIGQLQRVSSGVQLLLQGESRGIALRVNQADGFLQAVVREVEELEPIDPHDAAFVGLVRELRERAIEVGQRAGFPRDVVQQVLGGTEKPGRLADLIAGYLELPHADRQILLELLSIEERLRQVLIHVQRQISVLDAQEDIKTQVQQELGDRQREMVLREQMKAIQNELGENGEGDDLGELRKEIAALELPAEARKEVDRELSRIERISQDSMEYQVLRTYLETVAELPWSHRSLEHIDLDRAERVLDEDHYGLQEVKDRILEFLAVRQLQAAKQGDTESGVEVPDHSDKTKGPILLFVGPPGVGKTSIAKSIARAMGREYVRISLGGTRDEADIRGHRRTYVGAMPGRILQGMKQAGTKNPVFLLDEVDKLGASYQGDPASGLLEVLDPAQNDSFVDHYLGVPFDLSDVLFIATANFIQSIPGPLLDRMETVEFTGYTEQEKLEIARRYLIPRQLEENALDPETLRFKDEAISEVIARYTRESGVRQLERELGKIARKVARRVASEEVESFEFAPGKIKELLGRPKIHPERAATADQTGVATGMFYTPAGGDIMFVEVTTMTGKGELVLTGQLGDVMKESARAAWSFARSHAETLGIDDALFQTLDAHIHVPAGAIPKDGPSAGVTMATALVSALAGRPARHDLAMTGEITLTGRILPIGGLKEKVLGALRAGITEIALPLENQADLEDLPDQVRDALTIYPVEDLGQLLALALRGGSLQDGRLTFQEAPPVEREQLPSGLSH
ncbi:MAG: endopeptidase La [Thermoanaerobaculia bacterium]